ncbi:Iron-sulfur cluster assembly protein SufB [Salmonella enterica subsp. enterica]|uniref:Iron-sulfur cluster assembly protein SufB n=1 Tax=Salmonella enterica I TaxID=59201 RepID=A0A447U432_SALET|nr:Iron-sulfur cluster assembly protein SufB [Salmonella enterica subsp. enterica]
MSKEVEDAFEQLGVPVREGKEVAVDAIFDSVSVATTYREKTGGTGHYFLFFWRSGYTITLTWSGNILAPSCRGTITFLPR